MRNWVIAAAILLIATRLAAGRKAFNSRHWAENGEGAFGWPRGLIAFGVFCAVLGLAFRLNGITSSLGLDEFGTLWTVEGGLSDTFARSQSFQGQSPLYYSIVWLFVRLFGESELVLRLPSLLLTMGAGILIYKAGNLLLGIRCGVVSASVFWLSNAALTLTTDARPYALSVFFTALVLYGFFLAAAMGAPVGRVLFILGGAGLVAAHYVSAIILLGVGVSYLAFAELRRKYSFPKFSADVLLQGALIVPAAGQILTLWGRRSELAWLEDVSPSSFMVVFRPEMIFLVGALAAAWSVSGRTLRIPAATLAICMATPPLFLLALAQAGTNLVNDRYMTGLLVPLCLLIGYCVRQATPRLAALGALAWLLYSAMWWGRSYASVGSFTRIGSYDWRAAVATLDKELNARPEAPVLYRSGFIEDDLRLRNLEAPESVRSPLRSPGEAPPAWNLVPLSYNWIAEGREAYFKEAVKPAIARAAVFYYLSCDCGSGSRSVNYHDHLMQWVVREPPPFTVTPVPAGQGMVLLKFERVIQRSLRAVTPSRRGTAGE